MEQSGLTTNKYIPEDDRNFVTHTLQAAIDQIEWLEQLLHRQPAGSACIKTMLGVAKTIMENVE